MSLLQPDTEEIAEFISQESEEYQSLRKTAAKVYKDVFSKATNGTLTEDRILTWIVMFYLSGRLSIISDITESEIVEIDTGVITSESESEGEIDE